MKKKVMFIILLCVAIFGVVGCQKQETKNDYQQYEVERGSVYLGDKNAKHNILLAFDYSCPWCKKWITEVLPELKTKYVDGNEATYSSQPVALLNKKSLFMAEVDEKVKHHAPEKYYDVQHLFAKTQEEESWGTETFVKNKLGELGIDISTWNQENSDYDPLKITRDYTKNKGVKSVPTLFIDGIQIHDPFNLNEIDDAINGKIKVN